MNRRWWLVSALLVLCCAGFVPASRAEAPKKAASPRWLSDWEQGRKEARANGKPIFVVFRCEH
jgi:hypothetical protein